MKLYCSIFKITRHTTQIRSNYTELSKKLTKIRTDLQNKSNFDDSDILKHMISQINWQVIEHTYIYDQNKSSYNWKVSKMTVLQVEIWNLIFFIPAQTIIYLWLNIYHSHLTQQKRFIADLVMIVLCKLKNMTILIRKHINSSLCLILWAKLWSQSWQTNSMIVETHCMLLNAQMKSRCK